MFKIICLLLAILIVVHCASVPSLEPNVETGAAGEFDGLEQLPPISPESDDLEKSEHRWGGWGRRYGGWGGYRSYSWGYPRYYGGWGYPRYYYW